MYHLLASIVNQRGTSSHILLNMPWLGWKRSSVERQLPKSGLVVLGNQISISTKRNEAPSQMKTSLLNQTSTFCSSSQISRTDDQQFSCDSDFRFSFSKEDSSESLLPWKKQPTVDRGVQVDTIGSYCHCNDGCKSFPTPEVNVDRHAISTSIGNKSVRKSSITLKSHRFIQVTENCQSSNGDNKDCSRLNKLQTNELVKFAEKLTLLADASNNDYVEPLDLKNSTYLVLKKTQEVVLVQYPDDLKAKCPSTNSLALYDTEDELGSLSRGSITSIDIVPSELGDISPDLMRRKKTLYPMPCPAFPMEVSFPPVQF